MAIRYTKMVKVVIDEECIHAAHRGDSRSCMVAYACKRAGLPIQSAFTHLEFSVKEATGHTKVTISTPEKMMEIMRRWDAGVNPLPFEFDIYFNGAQPVYISLMRPIGETDAQPRQEVAPALPVVRRNEVKSSVTQSPEFRQAVQACAEELVRAEIERLRASMGAQAGEPILWFSFDREKVPVEK